MPNLNTKKQSEQKSDFLNKKITQTEYRGSSYKSSFDKKTQFLDSTLSKLDITDQLKPKFKKHIQDQITLFLSKIVSEEDIEKILNKKLIQKIFSKLGI